MKREIDVTKSSLYVGVMILAVIFPFILSGYSLYILVLVGFYIILALGLNLIFGYTGQISICHGAFYAMGAYSSAILVTRLGWSFWIALPVSIIITIIFAILVGIPMLRTRGPYFAIGTMSLGVLVTMVINNWVSLTGGVSFPGIPPVDPIPIPGLVKITFTSLRSQYYLVLVLIVLSIFIVNRLVHSRVGRAFIAIRENEELAEALGINAMKFKILSFTVGAALAGMAGAFYAGFMGAIDPGMAFVMTSFTILVMIVVGGTGTITGAIIGPVFLWVFPEMLYAADEYRLLLYGLVVVLVIIFMPHGVAGRLRALSPRISELFP
jgi:branched-chain amino acid transport system permease protein